MYVHKVLHAFYHSGMFSSLSQEQVVLQSQMSTSYASFECSYAYSMYSIFCQNTARTPNLAKCFKEPAFITFKNHLSY